jgi:hypothetical protein
VKSWFGYGLHLIADTHYEIPVAFHLTPASHSEQVELRTMLDKLFDQTPELAERCADFSADRGLDCAETKAKLWDDYHIRPLIDTRALWRSENWSPIMTQINLLRVLFTPIELTLLCIPRKGTVHCICLATGTQRDLAFQGFEADRNTLKYRCPAAAYGLDCRYSANVSACIFISD